MIVWTDVETTGLDCRRDSLLEVALVVTTDDLEEVGAIDLVVRPVASAHPPVVVDFVRKMHADNGLWRDVEERGLRRYEASPLLLKFVEDVFRDVPPVATHACAFCGENESEHRPFDTAITTTPEHGVLLVCQKPGPEWGEQRPTFKAECEPAVRHTPLAGSTVGFDRGFLRETFPELERQFSHRSVDVSTITELARRWAPTVYKNRPKAGGKVAHRALADVRESIAYLRYYRSAGFLVGRVE